MVLIAVMSIVCCDRGSWCGDEFGFVIEQLFVDFSDAWCDVTKFHLINYRFIVFGKTSKNVIDLVFMIDDFSK